MNGIIRADTPTRRHQWMIRYDDINGLLILESSVDGRPVEERRISARHPSFNGDAMRDGVEFLFREADQQAGFHLSWNTDTGSPTLVAVSEEVAL